MLEADRSRSMERQMNPSRQTGVSIENCQTEREREKREQKERDAPSVARSIRSERLGCRELDGRVGVLGVELASSA